MLTKKGRRLILSTSLLKIISQQINRYQLHKYILIYQSLKFSLYFLKKHDQKNTSIYKLMQLCFKTKR